MLQLLAALYKVYILRGRWEYLVGTISATGGGIATSIPLFGIAYAIAFYILYKRRNLYLILGFSLLFVAFASGKRGIYYYVPVFISISYFIIVLMNRNFRKRTFATLLILIILSAGATYYGVTRTPTLNPQGTYGGGFDAKYVVDYAVLYSSRERGTLTTGRWSTTMRTLGSLIGGEDLNLWWSGLGPDTLYRRTGYYVRNYRVLQGTDQPRIHCDNPVRNALYIFF